MSSNKHGAKMSQNGAIKALVNPTIVTVNAIW